MLCLTPVDNLFVNVFGLSGCLSNRREEEWPQKQSVK